MAAGGHTNPYTLVLSKEGCDWVWALKNLWGVVGRQAWGQQGLGVQVGDGGSLWRGLWAGKNWMGSRGMLVTVGKWVERVWRERVSMAPRSPVAERQCGRRAGWLWGLPGMGTWENKMCGDDAVVSLARAEGEGLVGCTGERSRWEQETGQDWGRTGRGQ